MDSSPDSYDREFDFMGLSEKKRREAIEQRAMVSMIQYPRVSEYFDYMKKHFQQPLQDVALATYGDRRFLMDKYLPADILKMFNGLEIHNLNKAFSKFQDEITLEAFIVIGLRILDIPKNDSAYVLLGMMNLYHSLTTQKGKKILTFRDFLNNFIRVQSMFSEHKSFVNEENKTIRFYPSSIQDNTHHDNPIRNAFYSKSLKLLFSLDEAADHIRIYSTNAELKGKICPERKNHLSRSIMIMMDFAWSESKKKIGACSQDMTISFFSSEDNFTKEEVYPTDTLQTEIWYVEFCNYWFTTDVVYNLFYWDKDNRPTKITARTRAKVSNVSELSALGLVAIASYDKKITLFNPVKNVMALVITQDDCSAHTLKYSKEQNMFFAASFGQAIRIYQIDKARDYTRVGKLESPSTTTALELIEEYNMILTCDDEGNLKSWDSHNFKSLQHYVLHSLCPITKIINMEDTTRFCIVTNRLNLFDLCHVTFNTDKNQQIVPFVRYCAEKEEIIVALNDDIRVFSLRYGILSEIYDKELYNVDDTKRIVNFKKSAKGDNAFFVDYRGIVRLLTVATNAKANQGFQPFKTDNSNFIFYEHDNLLVTWHRNSLHIYRYEISTHTNLLLRSILLPEIYQFTGVKVYRSKGVLATILNHTMLIFWEFHKVSICGVYLNYEENFKLDLDDSVFTPLAFDTKSPMIKNPLGLGMNMIREQSQAQSSGSRAMSPNKKKYMDDKSMWNMKLQDTKIKTPMDTVDDKTSVRSFMQNLSNEMLDLNFIEEYNCFLIVDGKYDVFLIEQKAFEEFGVKVKLNIGARQYTPDYYYTKVKVKPIDFKPLLKEKALRMEEIEHFYNKPEGGEVRDKDIQYLLFLTDSENQIMVLNLNDVLAKHFKSVTTDGKFKQPFYTSRIEFNEANIQNLVEKARQSNKPGLVRPMFDIPTSKMTIWKAGESPVLDTKVVIFNTIIVISLSQNTSLQLWNIKGELVGQLYVRDTKRTIWNLNQYNIHQRVEVFQRTKQIFENIYNKFENEIINGCQNALDTKFQEKLKLEFVENESNLIKPVKETKTKGRRMMLSNKFAKSYVEEENNIPEEEKATVKAEYVLERDKRLLASKKMGDEDPFETIVFADAPNEPVSKKKNPAPILSSYTQNLAKKLLETVEENDDNSHDGGHRTKKRRKTKKSKSKSKQKTGGRESLSQIPKAASQKYIDTQAGIGIYNGYQNKNAATTKIVDYIDIYTQATRSEAGLNVSASQNDLKSFAAPATENSILQHIHRSIRRVHLLKDLDHRMKKVKNNESSIDVKETVVGLPLDIDRSKISEKVFRNEPTMSKSVQGRSTGTINGSKADLNTMKIKMAKNKHEVKLGEIERNPILMEMSIDKKMLSGSKTTKESSTSEYFTPGNLNVKRVRLPVLKYDPQVDQEIIKNMDNLERMNKRMSKNAQNAVQKKTYSELAVEIEKIRGSRKKSLHAYGELA